MAELRTPNSIKKLELTEAIMNLSLLSGKVQFCTGWVDREIDLPTSFKRTAFRRCLSLLRIE